jgi:hypothetical protein
MKGLSFRQPWALLTALGLKPVDNREWRTSYRGPVYIHASEGPDYYPPPYTELWLLGNLKPEERELFLATPRVKGAIIAEANLIDCLRQGQEPLFPEYRSPVQWSPWFVGGYGLVFADPKLYPAPIPYKGGLKLFEVNFEGGTK